MRFFFYGTLSHTHDNPLTRQVLPLLGPPRRGWVQGALYAVRDPQGWYPALVPGRGRVWGWVYESGPRFDRRTLALLDAYEQVDRPRAEYRRQRLTVVLGGGGTVGAQAYVFNRPCHAGMRRVADGDFAAFVAARRIAAFAERQRSRSPA